MPGYDASIGQKLIEAFLFYQPRLGGPAPPTMGVDPAWRGRARRSDLHQDSKFRRSSVLWKAQCFDCVANSLQILAVVTDDSLWHFTH
eukprot:9034921-Pyramimonas_sp.AAC.1